MGLLFLAILALLTPGLAARSSGSPAAPAPPGSGRHVGGSSRAPHERVQKEIEDKKLPGAVMLVARKGKLVYASALGVRDPKSADPMRTDTIFRIYSMTKPIGRRSPR